AAGGGTGHADLERPDAGDVSRGHAGLKLRAPDIGGGTAHAVPSHRGGRGEVRSRDGEGESGTTSYDVVRRKRGQGRRGVPRAGPLKLKGPHITEWGCLVRAPVEDGALVTGIVHHGAVSPARRRCRRKHLCPRVG